MKLAIIVAMAANSVIGRDNRLPWHLPEDLKYFKSVTMGKPVIMGRKTFESIGRPLPGRTNIVVSRQKNLSYPGTLMAQSLAQAIDIAGRKLEGQGEAVIIGGEQLYRQSIERVDRIYLTRIERDFCGDAFFPAIDLDDWRTNRCGGGEGPEQLLYEFLILDRK